MRNMSKNISSISSSNWSVSPTRLSVFCVNEFLCVAELYICINTLLREAARLGASAKVG